MVDLNSRPPTTRFSERTGLLGVRVMESINISLFRLSRGRVGGRIWGTPVILLTVTGRKTGLSRTKPLLALPDGDDWIVAGSRGGTSGHPEWFLNLTAYLADPSGTAPPVVEAALDVRTQVTPTVLEGDDRTRWWNALVEVYSKFDSYQLRSPEREIPVVRLSPVH